MRLYGQITKVTPEDDGTVRVEGIASSEAIDEQGEIVRADAIREAIPDYMRFPALREMHQLSAAGTTIEAEVDGSGITRIVARVVDPVAISKVKNLVYRGFSIGGRVTKRDSINSKIITGIQLNEISLVDRPANPEAIMECWKSSNIERTDDMKPGLATLGDTPASEALVALASSDPGADAAKKASAALVEPVQIWHCGDSTHSHVAKGEATKCIEKRAASGENGGNQWAPQAVAEAVVPDSTPAPKATENITETSVVDETSQKSASVDTPPLQPEVPSFLVEKSNEASAEGLTDTITAVPEPAGEAEAAAGAEESGEADPPAECAEKAAQEPSEAELAIAKAVELAVRARTALNMPAAADETSETASEGFTEAETANTDEAAKASDPDGDYGVPALIEETCAALRALVEDETFEIVAGVEVDLDAVIMTAAKASGIEPWLRNLVEHSFDDLALAVEKAAGRHTAKNQEMLDMAYECASRAASLDGCSKAATDHFDSAGKCMMAAGAKGWDTAKKASSEGMMIEALVKAAQHTVLADAAHDCIGKIMAGATCSTSKASKEDKDNLSMAHDHLCAAGATCHATKAATKTAAGQTAGAADQLAKAQSENAQLLKTMQEFAPLVERLLETNTSLADQIAKIDEKVDRIDQQEAPPRGLARSAGLFGLSKAQDNGAAGGGTGAPVAPVSPEEILKSINALPDSKDKAFLLMQIAHTNPRPVKMVSQAEINLPAQ